MGGDFHFTKMTIDVSNRIVIIETLIKHYSNVPNHCSHNIETFC